MKFPPEPAQLGGERDNAVGRVGCDARTSIARPPNNPMGLKERSDMAFFARALTRMSSARSPDCASPRGSRRRCASGLIAGQISG
jgi:hypothetical protein